MITLKTEGRFRKNALILNKVTIAHLSRSQMFIAAGGGNVPKTIGEDTCDCETIETICACTQDTTGDTGITPAPTGGGGG